MNYRADIQILRGVSVILVVLFHLGFSSIQSGFLGVDVFFVISGFLMAVLYKNSDISGFYLRRAKRLLPAYYATIFFTLIFTYLYTSPFETNQVNSQVKYALPFLSNIGFWLQDSYFSSSYFNPLLHLWSLGVEIQFYVIVPILYWFFTRVRSGFWITLLASFVLCILVVKFSPKTSFYMMPLRLWEFLIGYGIAYYLTNQGNLKSTKHQWFGLLGLLIVLIIPLFSVDGESRSAINGHPALHALLVTSATALVLAFGIPSYIERSYPFKLLERIGKYSYSIYLAHFPVIVIYLSQPFEGTNLKTNSLSDTILIFGYIVIASTLLYYFFEYKRPKASIKKYSIYATLLLISLIAILPSIKSNQYTEREMAIFNAKSDTGPFRCGVVYQKLERFIVSCDVTPEIKNPKQSIMLVGNSHSDAIKDYFKDLAIKENTKLLIPISNTFLNKGLERPDVIVNDAVENNVSKLVIHSSPDSISNETLSNIHLLAKNAGIKVYFIEPVPVWEQTIPAYMYQSLHNTNTKIMHQTKEDYYEKNSQQLAFVNSIQDSSFKPLSTVEYFCNPNCSYASKYGKPYYHDAHHLTLTGSKKLHDVYLQILND